MTPFKITFFKSPADLRRWFAKHHRTSQELWTGYYKKTSAKPSITWPESVDEALCVGWIDGIRKSVDDISYTIRFTPRQQRSLWSAVNVKRAQELIDQGLMQPAGLKAFQEREENGTIQLRNRGAVTTGSSLDRVKEREFSIPPGMSAAAYCQVANAPRFCGRAVWPHLNLVHQHRNSC